MSKWNHTRIFSEFSDDETEDSGGEYLGGSDSEHVAARMSRPSKAASSQLRSKVSKSRSVFIPIQSVIRVCGSHLPR